MLERLDGAFPLAAFPRRLQEYIRTARDTLNFPEPYTASVMLLAVAVAIGNTRVLKMKEGWLVKPILFLALVGDAGANKSHPISFVLKPLDRINNEHIEAYNKALADYRKTVDDILSVPEPFICVIGSIQPGMVVGTFSGERQSNGFLYRILQARDGGSTKLLWDDKGFPFELEQFWDGFLRSILEKCDKEYFVFDIASEYTFTEDALFHIMDWQNRWEEALEQEGRPSQVEAFRKNQDYAVKFSLILHTMKEAAGDIKPSTQISFDTAVMATLIAEYFFFTALQSLDAIEEQNPQRYPRSQADFIIALPEVFTTADAVKKGKEFGLSESTVKRLLRDGKGRFFVWTAHGEYTKKS